MMWIGGLSTSLVFSARAGAMRGRGGGGGHKVAWQAQGHRISGGRGHARTVDVPHNSAPLARRSSAYSDSRAAAVQASLAT
ncbi:hypothetical protein JKP88DRAFT_221398 [Tribonema minus]|uniref:Secreted protein n=1 Tax=Tribonema minus TaxID=303371 RepID=A0A835YVS0_9STRA|nr:hypothetical protein JKP88DRAFT_221398 [Tribonema minus]